MSNDQKQNELSPEEERKNRKTILSKYKRRPYWTLTEGIHLLDPDFIFYNEHSPSGHGIFLSIESFDNITRSIEIENDYIIPPIEDIKKRSIECREYWAYIMNKKEKEGACSSHDLLIFLEMRDKLFGSIKIRPNLFLAYVKNNPDLFLSSKIPSEFIDLIDDKSVPAEIQKTEIEQLLKDVAPELKNLFDSTKQNLKQDKLKVKEATAEQICKACYKAYQDIVDSKEIVDSIKFIEKSDIDCNHITDNTEHLPRELKGPLLHNLVFRKFKKIPNGIGIPTNYQGLYALYNRLKKPTKK